MAVLTDYVSMEAYKGDTLTSIYNSMAILAEFSSQVLVLKNTLIICGLSGRGPGLQKRLIHKSQTRDFSDYCRNLAAARNGNTELQHQLLNFGREATQHIDERMIASARNFPKLVEHIASNYTKDELVALRTATPFSSEEMSRKFILSVLQISTPHFEDHPRVQKLPRKDELPNTFIFRAGLCTYLLALDWIVAGGAKGAIKAKGEKLRNDLVDVTFAAYATYFDGLLSRDDKAMRIYTQAKQILSLVFGCRISGSEI